MKRVSLPKGILRTVSVSVFAFAVALTPLSGVELASAAVGTQTWTGAAGDNNFSTPGNWQENETPETGDVLLFNTGTPSGTTVTLTNDLPTNVRLGGVTVNGTNVQTYSTYYISGIVRLQDGATLAKTGSNLSIYLYGGVDVAGDLMAQGSWNLSTGAVNGELTADATNAYQYGRIGGTGITGITSLILKGNSDFTVQDDIAFPITVAAGSASTFRFEADCDEWDDEGSTCISSQPVTRTISSALTLNADLNVAVDEKVTVQITGTKTGTGSVIRDERSHPEGTLLVNGQALVNPTKTTNLDGDTGGFVDVYDKETAILNGTRADIDVYPGGILKGNGTVTNDLFIGEHSLVAPGNSPGTITVQDELILAPNSTFEAELLNKDAYDKLIAGENYSGSSNAVLLNGANLDLKFITGGKVNQGETFTIIDNRSTTAISGTFAGLAEGARITIGSAVFAISYVGGTGNDVVLTALTTANAPATPNTGFRIVTGNPILVAGIGIVAAGALLVARRRFTR